MKMCQGQDVTLSRYSKVLRGAAIVLFVRVVVFVVAGADNELELRDGIILSGYCLDKSQERWLCFFVPVCSPSCSACFPRGLNRCWMSGTTTAAGVISNGLCMVLLSAHICCLCLPRPNLVPPHGWSLSPVCLCLPPSTFTSGTHCR